MWARQFWELIRDGQRVGSDLVTADHRDVAGALVAIQHCLAVLGHEETPRWFRWRYSNEARPGDTLSVTFVLTWSAEREPGQVEWCPIAAVSAAVEQETTDTSLPLFD